MCRRRDADEAAAADRQRPIRSTLAAIYDPDMEKAARDAYGKDYTAYGFGNWAGVTRP